MSEYSDQRRSVEESRYLLPFHICRQHYGALDVLPSVKLVPGQFLRNRYFVQLPPAGERDPRAATALYDGLLLPDAARRFVQVEIPEGEGACTQVGVEESAQDFKYKLYFTTPMKLSAATVPKRLVPAWIPWIRAVSWTPGAEAFTTKEYVPIELLSEAGAMTEIRAALATQRGYVEDARMRRVLDACIEMLALSSTSMFYAFRVRAPDEDRHWVDFKLDDRRPVTLRDVGRRVFDLAWALGTNAALCADWLKVVEGDLLSHLSVGSSRDGFPFVTLYNADRRHHPPPYTSAVRQTFGGGAGAPASCKIIGRTRS